MLISVAIPCYRAEKNLETVVEEIRTVFDGQAEHDYQVILVCDGSPDHTEDVIRKLCAADRKIVGLLLSRNFSQSNARMAALKYVQGDVLVYMDDDGQHPAGDIFRLADKIMEGFDVVYADFDHKEQSRFRIWTSDLFGWISGKTGRQPRGIRTASFMAYSRFAVDELKAYTSPTPTAIGYLYTVTSRFANVRSTQRKRLSGKSGYNLYRMLSLALTGMTNFTIVPLRMIDAIGFVSAVLGLIWGIVLVIRKLCYAAVVPGYTSNMVVMLVLGGMILVSLGLVGEYVGRIYMLLSNKPQYVIREELNVSGERKPAGEKEPGR